MIRGCLAALLLAGTFAGCNGPVPACASSDAASCSCTPSDVRDCVSDGGVAGLQLCTDQGYWGNCAPFANDSDGGQ